MTDHLLNLSDDSFTTLWNAAHSLDFRKYIQQDKSSTIPLTFNARERGDGAWRLC